VLFGCIYKLKQRLKTSAVRTGWWYQFRDHRLVEKVLLLQKPTRIKQRLIEISIYKKLLKQFSVKLVFDIGANCGSKTIIFTRYDSTGDVEESKLL
jgi:hypothetical protein